MEAVWKGQTIKHEEIIIAPSNGSGKYWQIIENTKMEEKGIYLDGLSKDFLRYFFKKSIFYLEGHIKNTYGEWMFKEGEMFIPDTLGFEMICNLPKSWILDCRSESKIVQLQMIHEFNSNGYIYTQRELKSGKNYKIIMKKIYKISTYHNDKKAALGAITEAHNIMEKDIEPKSMDLTQEDTKSKSKQALHFHEGHGPHNFSTKDQDQNLKFAKFCNIIIGHYNPNSELANPYNIPTKDQDQILKFVKSCHHKLNPELASQLSIITILQGIGLGIILIITILQAIGLGIILFFIRKLRSKSFGRRSTRQN